MSNKKKKWVVQVPVTVMLCAEVTAPNKEAAILAANQMVDGLEAYYTGDARLDRPPYVGILSDAEDHKTWFDSSSLDCCDLFLSDKTHVEPWTNTDD